MSQIRIEVKTLWENNQPLRTPLRTRPVKENIIDKDILLIKKRMNGRLRAFIRKVPVIPERLL